MKLTKAKLLNSVREGISDLGFCEFKDSITGAQGLFAKIIASEYYLTLGLTISRYYDSMFTADYYFSKTTRWGSVWGDIPAESFDRVGSLLTKTERRIYLDEQYNKEGVIDTWWDGQDKNEIFKFISVVRITETRFVDQPLLVEKINSSSSLKKLIEYSNLVITKVLSGKIHSDNYQFIPQKEIDDIPVDWFKAAEMVLIEQNGIINVNTVKLLGADSFRQFLLKDRCLSTKLKQDENEQDK